MKKLFSGWSRWRGLKKRVDQFKREGVALYWVVRHPRAGWPARILALAAVAYVFSPIDLIPDWIPLAGWLDDAIVVPVLAAMAVKLVPKDVMEECRQKADASLGRLRRLWRMLLLGLLLWVIAAFGLFALMLWGLSRLFAR